MMRHPGMAVGSGTGELAPYICLADISGIQGALRCDFRFHRGGPTRVKVRLPVV